MSVYTTIDKNLRRQLQVEALNIVDESHMHAGHAGAPKGGESHFRVMVVARDFEGLSRVKRHQLVYKALKSEMAAQIHALALSALTPQEYKSRAE